MYLSNEIRVLDEEAAVACIAQSANDEDKQLGPATRLFHKYKAKRKNCTVQTTSEMLGRLHGARAPLQGHHLKALGMRRPSNNLP